MPQEGAKIIDIAALAESNATFYPEPYATEARKRWNRKLGALAGLGKIGVTLTRIEPGGRSSQRHWHAAQDEFIYVLQGEVTLHDDAGHRVLKPGMCVGFPAGAPNGHCFLNHTGQDALILCVADNGLPEEVTYPEADMHLTVDVEGRIKAGRK